MARRSYAQFCPAARALDVVGERWTILIVRELLSGPKRYTDLIEGLPGIAPNVLAPRLRALEDAGIVVRAKMPPPAASKVYELTELGQDLRPVVQALSRWGLNVLGGPRPGERVRPSWLLATLEASFRPEAARGVHETYEFRVDGEVLNVRIDDGEIEVRQGPAADPDCAIGADLATFLAVASRQLAPEAAVSDGLLDIEGDPEAAARSIEILGPHFGMPEDDRGLIGAIQSRIVPETTEGISESYEFRLGEEILNLRVDNGEAEVRIGPADDPAFAIETDLATFLLLGTGALDRVEAETSGRAAFEGDPEAGERMLAIFGISPAPSEEEAAGPTTAEPALSG